MEKRIASAAAAVQPLVLLIAAANYLSGAAPFSFQTHYINLGPAGEPAAIAVDATGNIFVLSILASGLTNRITKTDAYGNFLSSYDSVVPSGSTFGYGGGLGAAIKIDSAGNVIILENGFQNLGSNALIVKLDNDLTRVLASATLGNPATGGTGGMALALDRADNVYITGQTWAPDFPVTPGAYDTTRPPLSSTSGDTAGDRDAFVTEFSSDLSKIVYSTLYGDASSTCGQDCTVTTGNKIAVATDGSVIIAGTSNSTNLLSNVQSPLVTYGFVTKFAAGLGSVAGFATLGGGGAAGQTVRDLALDASGDLLVVGSTGPGLSISGAMQAAIPGITGGYLAEFDPAVNLKWGTYLGGGNFPGAPGTVNGIVLDSAGGIWITGSSMMSALPGATTSSTISENYIAELMPDGSSVMSLTGTQQFIGEAMAIGTDGTLAILGPSDSFLLSAPPGEPAFLTVTNAANNVSSGTIAPAEIIALYGSGIGPSSPLSGQVVNGAFGASLGGYQVLFNGTPAPILYAGAGQINVVAPVEIAGQQTVTIQLVGPQATTTFPSVFVANARPQLFPVVTNQDGTVNSALHPAPANSVVTLWATGTGLPGTALTDGSLAPVDPPFGTIPVNVSMTISPLFPSPVVEYSGQAPGAVLGLTQINVQLPTARGAVLPSVFDVQIQVAGVWSSAGYAVIHASGIPIP